MLTVQDMGSLCCSDILETSLSVSKLSWTLSTRFFQVSTLRRKSAQTLETADKNPLGIEMFYWPFFAHPWCCCSRYQIGAGAMLCSDFTAFQAVGS